MVNFTPPIKMSLFISLLYLVCFQFFLQSENYVWLYPANIVFLPCSVLYVLFLDKVSNAKLNMLILTAKGMKLSFMSSLFSFTGAVIIFLLNFYLFPGSIPSHPDFKKTTGSFAIIFTNAFLVNLVLGSLAAFLTAGLMNEKKYEGNSRPLPSVKN